MVPRHLPAALAVLALSLSTSNALQLLRPAAPRPAPTAALIAGAPAPAAAGAAPLLRRSLVSLAALAPRTALAAGAMALAPGRPPPWLKYAMIPLVAGLLNWATNQLAVKMMFYPQRWLGLPRWTRVGWQGIVPAKATQMANDIVDDVIYRLINVSDVFQRLRPRDIAKGLPDAWYTDLGRLVADDIGYGWAARAPSTLGGAFNATVRIEGRALVASIVRAVQAEVEAAFDLRSIVVRGIASDTRVLVELFERCGEDDLRFVVNSGLWLGGALGVLQMGLWLVWNPWWSLALTGAAVGFVTDQLAINAIFLPVERREIGPFCIHGLFLRRQDEVADDFAEFMQSRVLNAPAIWDELLTGSNSIRFWEIVDEQIRIALPRALGPGALLPVADELRPALLARIREELPKGVPHLYELTDDELDLRPLMRDEMRALPCAEFERVLHPVFEEDELTLILIGTALGGIAGAAQALSGI